MRSFKSNAYSSSVRGTSSPSAFMEKHTSLYLQMMVPLMKVVTGKKIRLSPTHHNKCQMNSCPGAVCKRVIRTRMMSWSRWYFARVFWHMVDHEHQNVVCHMAGYILPYGNSELPLQHDHVVSERATELRTTSVCASQYVVHVRNCFKHTTCRLNSINSNG